MVNSLIKEKQTVAIPKFNRLGEARATLKRLEEVSSDNQAAAGMTTVGILAAAMIKIIDEVEDLKKRTPSSEPHSDA
jgi:hypothetical protein